MNNLFIYLLLNQFFALWSISGHSLKPCSPGPTPLSPSASSSIQSSSSQNASTFSSTQSPPNSSLYSFKTLTLSFLGILSRQVAPFRMSIPSLYCSSLRRYSFIFTAAIIALTFFFLCSFFLFLLSLFFLLFIWLRRAASNSWTLSSNSETLFLSCVSLWTGQSAIKWLVEPHAQHLLI